MIDLRQGDCLEILKDIPDGSVDLVLADPPYGTTACKWDIVIPFEPMWEELNRIIKPTGIVCLFGSEPFSSALRMSNIKNYKYDLIWRKEQGTNQNLCKIMPLKNHENISIFYKTKSEDTTELFSELKDYMISEKEKSGLTNLQINNLLKSQMSGHYFTRKTQFSLPTKKAYEKLQQTGYWQMDYDELKKKAIYYKTTYNPQMTKGKKYTVLRKSKVEYNPILDNHIKRTDTVNSGERYPVSVLEFNREIKNRFHPTQKPVALLEYLIKTYSNEGETVLDFTMGSGSTGVACVNTNRNFIGIEKDPKYFEIAEQRIYSPSPSIK